jgi:Transglycosylase SLT domain
MADAPNSYKDPFWADLASKAEQKHGLPAGLLSSIVTKGERSNNDQVSEAGARTVFQITPETQKLILKKYKFDPYLSPQNAAEGAALLLKEGLTRNQGDVTQAVGEYIGGTDRSNWGPVTRNYIKRVTGGESTFQRAMSSRQDQQEPQIASILNAYRTGKMTPEDAKAFEQDVNSGAIMLPSGESLKAPKQAQGGNIVPTSVVDAYLAGKMTPEDMASFRKDIKAGLIDVPDGYGAHFEGSKAKTGADLMERVQPSAPATPRPDLSLAEQAIGTGEAALTLGTGMAGTIAGTVGGAVSGAVQTLRGGPVDIPGKAQEIATAMTYQPRGEAGQQQLQAAGEVMQAAKLDALGPMVQFGRAAEMAPAVAAQGQAMARAAVPAAVQRVQQAAAPIQRAAQSVRESVVERVPGFGAGQSVGAAETPAATIRRERAAQMPVPFEGESALTTGQASRDFEQLQFEKETAKLADTGAPLRNRGANQRDVLEQNFDALIDVANPTFVDESAIGGAVDRALVNRANVVMRKVRDAYQKADEAGELEAPVQMDRLQSALAQVEDMRPFVEKELNAIERVAQRIGALVPDENGNLTPGTVSLRQSETLRQYINDSIDWTDKRQARVGAILKDGIDAATEGAGGELYAKARALKRQQVQEFENTSLTRKLTTTKRNTDERNIALEDVYRAVIVRSSVEEMNKLRSTLLKSGQDGKDAWASLKAKAIDDIKQAGLTQQTDERGSRVMSAAGLNKAIERFDQGGKLDALYGKKQAQVIRDLGDIARDIYTAPPGAVNFSNTASALRVALDSVATFGLTGIPAPAATALKEATKYMKDRQVRNRVREALQPTQQSTGKF